MLSAWILQTCDLAAQIALTEMATDLWQSALSLEFHRLNTAWKCGKLRWGWHYSNTIEHETLRLLEILWLTQPQRFAFPLVTLTHIIVSFLASLSLFSSSLMILSHCCPPKWLLGIWSSFQGYAQQSQVPLDPLPKSSSSLPLHIPTGQRGADQRAFI